MITFGCQAERRARTGSAIAEVPDRASIRRAREGLAIGGPSPVKRAGQRSAVVLGGPDDWDAVTGRHLAPGT